MIENILGGGIFATLQDPVKCLCGCGCQCSEPGSGYSDGYQQGTYRGAGEVAAEKQV